MKSLPNENHLCLLIYFFPSSSSMLKSYCTYMACRVYDNLVECKSTAPSKQADMEFGVERRWCSHRAHILNCTYVKSKLSIFCFIKKIHGKKISKYFVSRSVARFAALYFVWLNYSIKQRKNRTIKCSFSVALMETHFQANKCRDDMSDEAIYLPAL